MAAGKSVTNLAQVAAEAIAEKLGVDIVAIDMTEQMVLSEVQVDAIADGVFKAMAEIGEKPIRREGKGQWILLDYSDLVVHIQSQELRNYYMLDRLWNDCPRIPLLVSEVR